MEDRGKRLNVSSQVFVSVLTGHTMVGRKAGPHNGTHFVCQRQREVRSFMESEKKRELGIVKWISLLDCQFSKVATEVSDNLSADISFFKSEKTLNLFMKLL